MFRLGSITFKGTYLWCERELTITMKNLTYTQYMEQHSYFIASRFIVSIIVENKRDYKYKIIVYDYKFTLVCMHTCIRMITIDQNLLTGEKHYKKWCQVGQMDLFCGRPYDITKYSSLIGRKEQFCWGNIMKHFVSHPRQTSSALLNLHC